MARINSTSTGQTAIELHVSSAIQLNSYLDNNEVEAIWTVIKTPVGSSFHSFTGNSALRSQVPQINFIADFGGDYVFILEGFSAGAAPSWVVHSPVTQLTVRFVDPSPC